MKVMVLLIGFLVATASQASHLMYCDGRTGEVFTAILLPIPNLFVLQDAKVSGARTRTTFKCEPAQAFKDMKCVGYWNDDPSELIEATFTEFVYPGSYVKLKSVATNETKSWICKWK